MIQATVTMTVTLSDTVQVNEEPKVLETPEMALVIAKVCPGKRKTKINLLISVLNYSINMDVLHQLTSNC